MVETMYQWRYVLAALSLIALAYLAPTKAEAQSIPAPDSLSIDSVNAYDGVINSGDFLVVIRYNIAYASIPTVAASDTFIARFMVDNAEVNATEILAFNDLGYGLGVASMYFTEAQKEAASIEFNNPNIEDYEVVIQGKPSAFPDPPVVRLSSITYADTTNTSLELTTDIDFLANALQNDAGWIANGLELITFIAGQKVLTSDGEAYFGQAIPNLQIMIPGLFGSSTTSGQVFEREFGTSERDRLLQLWDTSIFNPLFTSLATDFRIGKVWVMGLIGVALLVAAVWFSAKLSGQPGFGLLAIPFAYPLIVSAGFGSMTALFFMAAIGVIGLFFSLFLRRAA